MYLTKLSLNHKGILARRDLGDAYELHRTLVRAFVSTSEEKAPRFLWRLELSEKLATPPAVLVQAKTPGNWSILERIPGYLAGPVQMKIVALDKMLKAGILCRFRLLANPTVTRGGRRYGLVNRQELDNWLYRQGERHGFSIKDHSIIARRILKSIRKSPSSLCLSQACFEGILEVCSVNDIYNAAVAGIGPGKAFGCGMLSLAPLYERRSVLEHFVRKLA